MIGFFLIKAISIVETHYRTTSPCGCDMTNLCDKFCCCDNDCNQSSIDQFKQYFCLPENPTPLYKISCDTNSRISKTKGIASFLIPKSSQAVEGELNDYYKCYIENKDVTKEGDIVNYLESQLGITYQELNISIPDQIDSNSYVYVPVSISSKTCNARILLNSKFNLDTSCLYPSTFPNNLFDVLGNNFNDYLKNSSTIVNPLLISYTSSNPDNLNIMKSTSDNDYIQLKVNTANIFPTIDFNGYSSNLDLITIDSQIQPLTFDSQILPFGSNIKISNPKNRSFNSPKLCPTYGCQSGDLIDIPEVNIDGIDIFTFMYRRIGAKRAFTYKIEKINLTHFNNTAEKAVIINHVEITEDGADASTGKDLKPYEATFSMIFSFLFNDNNDSTKAAAIVACAIISLFVWFVWNVYE